MIEIERKYLVTSSKFKEEAIKHYTIKQGFLNSDPLRTVRVRLVKDKGTLTVKGLSTDNGLTRFEWEKELKKDEAIALLDLCEDIIIDKVRYEIPSGDFIIEVDEFFGDNEGLIIAEIELNSVNDQIEKPEWLGNEVTGEIKFYNSQLSKNPYKNWK